MKAAQQHRILGVSAEASGDRVILQVGKEMIALTPAEARRVMYYLARAYTRADIVDLAVAVKDRA